MFGRRERIVRRVLVVEDEPLVAFDNEHLLEDAGLTVVATVDRADDAMRVLNEDAVDLVLADISLSGRAGNGIDVAVAAARKGVRVLFVSGQCPAEARDHAVGCLAKPYHPRDLLAALDVIEAIAAGRKPRRVPAALTLFG